MINTIKIHLKYFLLICKNYKLYAICYIFFEFYNVFFASFKNVYLFNILLYMLTYKVNAKIIFVFLFISSLTTIIMLSLSSYFHEVVEPQTKCLIRKKIDNIIFEKQATIDLKSYDNKDYYNQLAISSSKIDEYILNNFTQCVQIAKNIFSIITLVPFFFQVNNVVIIFILLFFHK